MRTPEVDFLGVEARVVMPRRSLDGVVLRRVALDDHAGTGTSPASPAGHLRQQAEGSLAGPKIGQVQPDIGVDYANGSYQREVEALGYHLRPDDDIGLTLFHLPQQRIGPAVASHDVLIPAQHASSRKNALCLGLNALRAGSKIIKRAAAPAALPGGGFPVVTAVTDQLGTVVVINERNIAVWAHDGLPAGATEDDSGHAPTVQEQDGLFAPAQGCAQHLLE